MFLPTIYGFGDYDRWKTDPDWDRRYEPDEPEDEWYEVDFDEFDILDYYAEAFGTI